MFSSKVYDCQGDLFGCFCIILWLYVLELHFALVIHFVLFLLTIVNHCCVLETFPLFATCTPHPVWIVHLHLGEHVYTTTEPEQWPASSPLPGVESCNISFEEMMG
jgi:hypothetical protein